MRAPGERAGRGHVEEDYVQPLEAIIDLLLGIAAAAYGTLIGAGGGFIMSPVLLVFFDKAQQVAAATSLTAVIFNAATAVFLYHRAGRIDYFTGLRFAATSVPGAVLGSIIAPYVPGPVFRLFFGIVLLSIAGYLAVRGERPTGRPDTLLVDEATLRAQGKTVRVMAGSKGESIIYGYNLRQGMLISGSVGVVSSLLGVGGGIILTPIMIALFRIPTHIAIATAQVILLISAVTGSASYLVQGYVDVPTAVLLGIGGIIGARIGTLIASRVKGKLIVRLLALGLLIVGARLLYGGIQPLLASLGQIGGA